MPLIDQLSKGFTSSARRKGHEYARAGRVTILSGDQWDVEAAVRGTQTYDVRIHRDEDEMFASCTCPHFYSGFICKHLWAVILVADQNHFLDGEGSGPVSLIADIPELDEYDSFEDGWELPDYRKSPQIPQGWKQQLGFSKEPTRVSTDPWPAGRRLVYVMNTPLTMENQILTLDVMSQDPKKDGELGKPRPVRIPISEVPRIPDANDRVILGILNGAVSTSQYDYYTPSYSDYDSASSKYCIRPALTEFLVPLLCRTERFFLKTQDGIQERPLRWDEGDPWRFFVRVRRSETEPKQYELLGYLRRADSCMDLSAPALLLNDGLVFFPQEAARLDHGNAFSWISALRSYSPITVREKQITDFLTETFSLLHPPELDLPEELAYEELLLSPRPSLTFPSKHSPTRLHAHLSYEYSNSETTITFHEDDRRAAAFDATLRKCYRRDTRAETEAQQQLRSTGFKFVSRGYYDSRSRWEISPKHFPRAVRELTEQNWKVEAEGKLFRSPGAVSIHVSSGIDWFELRGSVDYGDVSITMPELLAAGKKGANMVLLSDGSYGILPEDWLKKYAMFMTAGKTEQDHLRFQRSQLAFLDALLAAQPEAQFDATFASARKELLDFDGIREIAPPKTFHGTLRQYQKLGLGWLSFLRRFAFGGILADDMGLGKTVTILALLEERRKLRQKSARKGEPVPPSLVVVPTTLVFNWKLEASRFAPNLRVLDHTGVSRRKETEHFEDHDLVLTTYGTLRNDAVLFKNQFFDYIILDEAQAIKNAQTAAAKAARLLKGRHKLALSGTPVENHLGELWSLFEFLNPGMLGSARVFKMSGAAARNPDDQTRRILAHALRPFILRRTKQQVLQELPPKTEQTIYCELHPGQRKLYEELRRYYRDMLLSRVDAEGINKSKIYVLEALLRLRQAACHVGLIDPKRTHEPATKLETLMPQLKEVLEEGHKVLVFSQFTSFLAVLRHRLDKDGIPYEYLDGQTTDRQTPVERFQNQPDSMLFLISLKAGGLGLNLTAAEYVYLLDPWWNPVAEAQAIDRAHRIGQKRSVFAYRLIAQNTVEEKVLELQRTKRELADAIINADNSLIRNLAREDLELLLS